MRGLRIAQVRARRLPACAVAALVAVASAVPALADGARVTTAPYDTADHVAGCYGGVSAAATCTASADVSASQGTFSLATSDTAPTAGAGDNGSGHASGYVVSRFTIAKPAGYIAFRVVVHVSSASAGFTGADGTDASAQTNISVGSNDAPCAGFGCWTNADRTLVSSSGATSASIANQDLTFTYTMINGTGGNLPPGQINTGIDADATVGMGTADQGTSRSASKPR